MTTRKERNAAPAQPAGNEAGIDPAALQRALQLQRTGQLAESEALCRRLLAADPENIGAAVLAAQLSARRGDVEAGIDLLQAALRRQPDAAPALNGLAALSLRLRRLPEAEAACRRLLAIDPDNAVAHFNLGQVADAAGRSADALASYRRAMAINPELAAIRLPLAVALHKLELAEEAMDAYRRVTTGGPDQALALFNLGTLHEARGELAEAATAYEAAIAIVPQETAPRLQYANVLYKLDRFGEAADAYGDLLRRQPAMTEAHGNLAKALWAQGDASGALAACDAGLRSRPGDTAILAFKAVMLRESGNPAGARALVDHERFLKPVRIGPPPEFADVTAFNAALSAFVLQHPTLVHEARNHATKDGKHTGDLLLGPKGPIAALERIVGDAVSQYLRELPADAAHPFVANRPQHWKTSIWAVVMEGQGYQVPHIHPQAWLSGVYYARVPAFMAVAADQGGWIEFGMPLPEFGCKTRPEVRLVRPEEGLMLLFPAYFHHRTLPFQSTETRISLAFDVMTQGPVSRTR